MFYIHDPDEGAMFVPSEKTMVQLSKVLEEVEDGSYGVAIDLAVSRSGKMEKLFSPDLLPFVYRLFRVIESLKEEDTKSAAQELCSIAEFLRRM